MENEIDYERIAQSLEAEKSLLIAETHRAKEQSAQMAKDLRTLLDMVDDMGMEIQLYQDANRNLEQIIWTVTRRKKLMAGWIVALAIGLALAIIL